MQTFTLFHHAILPPWTDPLKGILQNLSGAGIEASKRIVPVVRGCYATDRIAVHRRQIDEHVREGRDGYPNAVGAAARPSAKTRVRPVLARKFSSEVSVMPNIAAWATALKYLWTGLFDEVRGE